MTQMARNAVDEDSGHLRRHRYVLHDGDAKFCADFRKTVVVASLAAVLDNLGPQHPVCRNRICLAFFH